MSLVGRRDPVPTAEGRMDNPVPGEDDSAWLEVILAPGSSLGGARPKATVQDSSGALWIAKFPSRNDVVDVGLWEYLIHQLAEEAGITLSSARIEKLSETGTTFLVKRFDRTPDNRLSLDIVRSVSPYFGLDRNAADRRLDEILGVVSRWRVLARSLGISRREIETMSPAFRAPLITR